MVPIGTYIPLKFIPNFMIVVDLHDLKCKLIFKLFVLMKMF